MSGTVGMISSEEMARWSVLCLVVRAVFATYFDSAAAVVRHCRYRYNMQHRQLIALRERHIGLTLLRTLIFLPIFSGLFLRGRSYHILAYFRSVTVSFNKQHNSGFVYITSTRTA